MGDGRPCLDPLAEQQSPLGSERSVSVRHEDLRWLCWLRHVHIYNRGSFYAWTLTALPTSVEGTPRSYADGGGRAQPRLSDVPISDLPRTVMNDLLANDRTFLAWFRTGIALFASASSSLGSHSS
jgi:hypothetical protein